MKKPLIISGAALLILAGGLVTFVALDYHYPSITPYGIILILTGALGLVGLAIKNSRLGIFYLVMGAATPILALITVIAAIDHGANERFVVAVMLPVIVAAALWIISGVRALQDRKR
ncbi:MAG: CDC50/LEM3 family protein [Coriobacteriia bacterium]|nr:CDC50/LEM3 family protein [Coriobacteriia bacterium]MCL2750311.1 CDC50/LEM3 family protein [Coriobacteriia bacterium]